MTSSPWNEVLQAVRGAAEAVVVAPYMKVTPLTEVLGRLQDGAAITCVTRWTPQDIHLGVSDVACRTIVVEQGGTFWLHPQLHAKYYRFDKRVLVGSSNMTSLGLGYPHRGNLEILCEPGASFSPGVFEASLMGGSSEVTDEEFGTWEKCPVIGGTSVSARRHTEDSNGEWIPRTRNPRYVWLHYRGKDALIVSDEQRSLAGLDLRSLGVPDGLTSSHFFDWVRLSIRSSSFMNSIRRFEGQIDAAVWDGIAEEWSVSRAIAARWVSTAENWLRYFDPGPVSEAK